MMVVVVVVGRWPPEDPGLSLLSSGDLLFQDFVSSDSFSLIMFLFFFIVQRCKRHLLS